MKLRSNGEAHTQTRHRYQQRHRKHRDDVERVDTEVSEAPTKREATSYAWASRSTGMWRSSSRSPCPFPDMNVRYLFRSARCPLTSLPSTWAKCLFASKTNNSKQSLVRALRQRLYDRPLIQGRSQRWGRGGQPPPPPTRDSSPPPRTFTEIKTEGQLEHYRINT